jgi:hypothetical protein
MWLKMRAASLSSPFIRLLSMMLINVFSNKTGQDLYKQVYMHLVKKFPVFEETENSLSSLQSATNGYCTEPVQSSPHPYTLLPKIQFNIIFPTIFKHKDNFN